MNGRNTQRIPGTNWILTTDSSGGIGEKQHDTINVPYTIVSRYAFRVAALDALSAGAVPKQIILHNYCGDQHWHNLTDGIQQAATELTSHTLPLLASTETNIQITQSAIAVTLLSEQTIKKHPITAPLNWHLIGQPLVGNEVTQHETTIPTLTQAMQHATDPNTAIFWPVGSKGIAHEWQQLSQTNNITQPCPFTQNLTKSAGPSTCWILGTHT